MFLVQRINTRPSTLIKFYAPTEAYALHFQTAYREHGMVLFDSRTLSDDLMTLTIDTVWRDEDALNVYLADPVVREMISVRDLYLAENNIDVVRKANPI
jgi:quinol monooxygenase YgiN